MFRYLIGAKIFTFYILLIIFPLSLQDAYANDLNQKSLTEELSTVASQTKFSKFKPLSQSKKSRLDYSVWDEALKEVVVDLGPSSRLRANRARASVGTRFVRGHKSPYRLEGSRFTFEYITDSFVSGLTEYRLDLQDIADTYEITQFSVNEQLAYWLNLYNVATLEKIAQAYPVQRPDNIRIEIKGQKYSLEEAPFITVMEENLSLNDIRENIVYKYWDSPNVIYGFFRGEVGGPMLQSYAFTGDNVKQMLNENADDFVNSLRGFNLGSRTRNVSFLYEESAPFFFPNFETDLARHLLRHAKEDVESEITKPLPIKIDRYDNMIADLSGGRRLGSSGTPTNDLGPSPEVARLLREVREKREYMQRRNQINGRKGYVIIEDLVPEEDKSNPYQDND